MPLGTNPTHAPYAPSLYTCVYLNNGRTLTILTSYPQREVIRVPGETYWARVRFSLRNLEMELRETR